ncbi:family 43 glycosylhydrolase [Dactylosporangium aurantiacum]|uniref:Family 43 glycosylhydrolase n=1 Tax=Dactylosporangium aurantiacum TaxID=35754 RepID=A0A9Q9MIE8_9ACTN|nr:family 43 glycosylhydrolase [Dactylosporangium aurantiacum]MDG6106745.1 family 43 glycosylhydrolase [Dactylosporangium aurantiacum]UWZ50892.1 family 43 glycosylhydrolase [Dactylosporangium aurantiacum]
MRRPLALMLLVAVGVPILTQPASAAPVTFTSTIVGQSGGQCATVPNGAPTNVLQLVLAGCTGAASQNFTFVPVANTTGTYTVNTLTAGSCVDVTGRSTADHATIIQYTCNGQTNQQFRLQAVTVAGATNTFNLVGVQSGKCVAPGSTGLVQLPCSSALVWRLPSYNGGTTTRTFTNPLDPQGPDPWLTYYDGYYYLASTTWNRTITMRKSRTLGGLATSPETVIFNLTRPNGAGTMWAPEFHLLTGPNGQRWYFYYTAGAEPYNLGTQRIHVLESAGLDPMGPYTFKADLLDPTQDNTWELDPSILQLNGQLYLLGTFYNGSQPMFIRPLSNPWTASGTRRILSTPTYSWETVGGAVNEGAEVLQRNGRTFIVYSASHCSTPDYKLGMLTYTGGDPLSSSSWVKSPQPVFQRSDANSVYAPGHNGFFKSPDGTEDWIVYHANSSTSGGCDMNRSTRAQKFTWNADGTPNFGVPVALGTQLAVPSGEPAS